MATNWEVYSEMKINLESSTKLDYSRIWKIKFKINIKVMLGLNDTINDVIYQHTFMILS